MTGGVVPGGEVADDTIHSGEGFARARGRGTGRTAQWLDRILPSWVVRHALTAGWLWLALWTAVAAAEELTGLPEWLFLVAVVLMVIPALAATAICLWGTPRDHLENRESVLGHFVGRFVAVVFGFLGWTVSIVIGASISSTIQLLGNNHESEVVGTGFQLVLATAPFVATLIWMGLIVRCAWFLARLRGWRACPENTHIPADLLGAAPRLRAWVIGVAHPGLLFVTGVLCVIAIVLSVAAVTWVDIVL